MVAAFLRRVLRVSTFASGFCLGVQDFGVGSGGARIGRFFAVFSGCGGLLHRLAEGGIGLGCESS